MSTFVILNRKHEHVATVHTEYTKSGTGRATVHNITASAQLASLRTGMTNGRITMKQVAQAKREFLDGLTRQHITESEIERQVAARLCGTMTGKAVGYGYDKQAAALAGLIVDGHTMADHCGLVPEDEAKRVKLLREYVKAFANIHPHDDAAARDWEQLFFKRAAKIGCRFANWQDGIYTSLHFAHGVDRLSMLGYRVIEA